jgi:ribosomal protein L11 methyltransferase
MKKLASSSSKPDIRRPISVFELKGSGRPLGVPGEGLEGVWPEPPYHYLFYRKEPAGPLAGSTVEAADPLVEWLKSNPGWQLTSRYDLPYEKWQDVSAPQISIGSFDVRFSMAREETPGRISMHIDPGVVFGSGMHPATQGCLLAISEVFRTGKIASAVDFGTGTGVLAIACALAGAKFVPAVDRNPLALKVAEKNIRANAVEDRIALVEADRPGCLKIRPDLFMMNLEWPVLEKILAAEEWRNSRRVILAGFLESRINEVERFATPEFVLDNVIEREGWPTVVLRTANCEPGRAKHQGRREQRTEL